MKEKHYLDLSQQYPTIKFPKDVISIQFERILKECYRTTLFKKTEKVIHPIDKGYIEALKYGLQDCSGIAIGMERLAMIFADVNSIDKLKLINIS